MSDESYIAIGVKEGDGWGNAPFVGKRAHYFKTGPLPTIFGEERPEITGIHISLCGLFFFATDRVPMLNPGNWPRCKLCEKSVAKAAA